MAKASTLIDFAERLVPPDQIKSAGYDGALVYVSELRPGANFDFKPVTREYADALRAAGLHVVSCYQYGKPGWPTPSDYTRGYDGGVADAQTALRLHAAAAGAESAPIFFSVDEDIDLNTWKSVAIEWFRGINSLLGVGRTGIYGHSRACAWAIGDGERPDPRARPCQPGVSTPDATARGRRFVMTPEPSAWSPA
jgi:hypothetical protein